MLVGWVWLRETIHRVNAPLLTPCYDLGSVREHITSSIQYVTLHRQYVTPRAELCSTIECSRKVHRF